MMSATVPIDLSIAIPCYNEEPNAEAVARAVIEQVEPLGLNFEIIFIDNNSSDRTVEIIKTLCATDRRIKLIVNSRDFGQLRSPTHAIYRASGAAVIGMCADFQDPPELIPQLVARWQAGADIILGVRRSEQNSILLRIWRGLSYRLLERTSDRPLIRHATGFGIYSRRVIDQLKSWNEPEPFFRAMLMETGLPYEVISYDRPPRRAGTSKNNFFTLLDFSLSAWSSSTRRLLRAPLFVSLGLFGLCGLFGAGALLSWFLSGGGATLGLAALIQANFAIILFFVGLAIDQIRVIGERTRGMPLVIEKEQVNIAPPERRP